MKANKMKTYNKFLYEYVEPEELSSIIEKVRRERQNKKDDIMLSQYCYNQIQTYLSPRKKVKEKPTVEIAANSESNSVKPLEPAGSDKEYWAEKKELPNHIKVDLINSTTITGQNCLCSCSSVRQDNISRISEETNPDNINNNSKTDVISSNKVGDKSRSLGYSNITVVSSHREHGNVDGADANTEKLKTVRLKIKRFLDTILSNVDTFKSPEDDTEKIQLKQKAVEFCGRFSRNHLYEIGRALNETTKALNYCLPYNQWKHVTSQSKSILNVHQVLLQAFSMFQRHMRIVWGYGDTHEKLHTLLQLALEVNRICFPQQDKVDSTFTDVQNGCNKLIETLNNIFGDDAKSCASKSTLYYREITPGFISRKMLAGSSRISNDVNHTHRRNMKWTGVHNPSNVVGDRFSMYRQQLPRRISQNRKMSMDNRNQRNSNSNMLPRKCKSAHGFVKKPAENNPRIISQKESKSCHQICPTSLSGLFKKTQEPKPKRKIASGNVKTLPKAKKCEDSHMELIYPNRHLEALDEALNISDRVSSCGDAGKEEQNKKDLKTSNVSERRDAIEDAARVDGCRYSTTPVVVGDGGGGGEGGQMKTTYNNSRGHRTISKNGSNNVLLLVLKHDEETVGEDIQEKFKEEKNLNTSGTNNEKVKTFDVNEQKQNIRHNLIDSFSKNILDAIKSPIPTHMNDRSEDSKKENEGIMKRDTTEKSKTNNKTPKDSNILKKKLSNRISPEVGEAIHNYRMDFVRSLMDNPLYVHKNIRRPWEAVARISEKLIDEAIRTVAEEMEMEALLKQMVDVELKDFATASRT